MTIREQLRQLIGDDAFDALSPEELRDLTTGDGEWIEELLIARSTLPLENAPALLSQSLRDIFDQHRLVQSFAAVLVADSRVDRRLVDVRGALTSSAWSLTFTCEVADIVLDVAAHEDRVVVDAHVMSHGNQAQAYGAHVQPAAAVEGEPVLVAESDRLGRVELGELQPEPYQLTFSNLRSVIELTVDFGPPSS